MSNRAGIVTPHKLLSAGFSILPCKADKSPVIPSWTPYQTERMTEAECSRLFNKGARIGVIGGAVSGNLECVDFDDPSVYQPFLDLLELRTPGLRDKLTLHEKTPRGGDHVIYRSEGPVGGNTKLAMKPGKDEQGRDTWEVRIETRGEGGYFLAAPSQGYKLLSGSLLECPVLSADEVRAIHETAKAFDLKKPTQQRQTEHKEARTRSGGPSPGDQYNQDNDIDDILRAYGWRPARRTTAGEGWTRPGKEEGVSGVLMDGTGSFYVFSSNASPLEPEQSYSAFALYTAYDHGGDFSAAARSLIQGKGSAQDQGNQAKTLTTNQKPDPTDPSIFLSVSSLLDVEESNRPDLWEREIPQGALVGISGQWGTMKSWLVQALGLKTAQGQRFLGRRLVEIDVFYFDLENPRSVWKRRMLDLAGQDRPERFHMMTLFGLFVPPAFDADGVAFYNKLAELHPASLFIFDSLVRFYPSGKQTENTEDAIHAMTTLKGFTRWGTTVIFLHHPPKNGGVFRGGGDIQAAPDLLYTLTHDKKAKRLKLECVKNRFDEGHTIEIEYKSTPEGGLVFVDTATAEEMKRRAENQKQTAAVLEIIKELHPKGQSIKTRLFEEGKKRFELSRRTLDPIIDNGVGVHWSCTKVRTSYIYAPFCTDDLYTKERKNAENCCNDKDNGYVHDEKTAFVHDEHDPFCSCTSCTHPIRGVHVHEGRNRQNDHVHDSPEADCRPSDKTADSAAREQADGWTHDHDDSLNSLVAAGAPVDDDLGDDAEVL
jgi:hypothetical protein